MKTNKIRITENELKQIVNKSVKKILKEHIPSNDYQSIYNDDYEEIIPLYDIFKDGFTFDEYHREKILLDTSLCYKDGQELGICLNDLCLKYKPNKK